MKYTAVVVASLALLSSAAYADNWTMSLTVDNEFAAYFGTPLATNFLAGTGNNWATTYTYTATGRLPSDYLYVATASDQSVAQGFIGTFTNTTSGLTTDTGSSSWQVFAAGNHPQTNPFFPNPWPAGLMPTQAQVDTAINFATTSSLWVAPDSAPGYTNGVAPWGVRPGIPASASWIWHRGSGVGAPANPLIGSFNHDEFLVFRVPGIVPAPASLGVMVLAGLVGRRRR